MIWYKLSRCDTMKRITECDLTLESMEALNEDHS